jgi:hypothetical protein
MPINRNTFHPRDIDYVQRTAYTSNDSSGIAAVKNVENMKGTFRDLTSSRAGRLPS